MLRKIQGKGSKLQGQGSKAQGRHSHEGRQRGSDGGGGDRTKALRWRSGLPGTIEVWGGAAEPLTQSPVPHKVGFMLVLGLQIRPSAGVLAQCELLSWVCLCGSYPVLFTNCPFYGFAAVAFTCLVFPHILKKNDFRNYLAPFDRTPEAAKHWFGVDLISNSSSIAKSIALARNFNFPIHEMIKIMSSLQDYWEDYFLFISFIQLIGRVICAEDSGVIPQTWPCPQEATSCWSTSLFLCSWQPIRGTHVVLGSCCCCHTEIRTREASCDPHCDYHCHLASF